MAVTELWLIFSAFTTVIAKQNNAIQTDECSIGEKIINDCNWCRCRQGQFDCDARNCKTVDKFGHFNDAIKDIDVGMEGHGTWRSRYSACQPSVAYRRGALLCVCNENGEWPNPTCRDAFRVFHSVEIADGLVCTPTKLYLQGCNICLCPNTGRLNSELCTKNKCHEDDPVLKARSEPELKETEDGVLDIYAACEANKKYRLGCKTCTCLRNNRLLCGNCTEIEDKDRHYCQSIPPNELFNIECNLCFCDDQGRMICSVKRCLGMVATSARRQFMDIDERYFELVDRPIDLHTCKIGTKYRKGCNICVCLEHDDAGPMFACSVRNCKNETLLTTIIEECVLHSSYELNCLRCSCVLANNEKWQWCEVENRCSNDKSEGTDLSTMHGYCEPLHSYFRDCNSCQCLSDGQSAMCSDEKCDQQAIAVEIVPMLQRGSNCPRGKAYKVDCNLCYCLLNGNSLCTTLDCKKQ